MSGYCQGCGAEMKETGAPIWETYCSNEKCSHDHDVFWEKFREGARERKRMERIKEAAPELLEALQKVVSWHGIRDAFDDLLPPERQSEEIAHAMRVIAKAEGKTK